MPTEKELLYGGAAYTGEMSPAEARAWHDVLGHFADLSQRFDAAYADLRAREPQVRASGDAALIAEHQTLTERARSLYATVDGIRRAVGDVRAALSGALSSITGAWDNVREWIGLGIPPLMPIAAVVAAVALLTAFLTDYAKFAKRASALQDLIARGTSPQEASAIVERTLRSDAWLSVGGIPLIAWLAGGVALYLWLGRRQA